MARCPSQDWDDYAAAQDSAAEAEVAWWALHKDRVLQVACAMLTNPRVNPFDFEECNIAEEAAKVVRSITDRAEPL
jgi:hypothetical protein